jgi:hypothetical protein
MPINLEDLMGRRRSFRTGLAVVSDVPEAAFVFMLRPHLLLLCRWLREKVGRLIRITAWARRFGLMRGCL